MIFTKSGREGEGPATEKQSYGEGQTLRGRLQEVIITKVLQAVISTTVLQGVGRKKWPQASPQNARGRPGGPLSPFP